MSNVNNSDAEAQKTKDQRFKALKSEVDKLKDQVNTEKQRYQAHVSREGIAVIFVAFGKICSAWPVFRARRQSK